MSARKVVQRLIDDRLLRRTDNSRLEHATVARGKSGRLRQVAFLTPAFASPTLMGRQYQLSEVVTAVSN